MYILGATILISGFFVATGQNGYRLVDPGTSSRIEEKDDPLVKLVKYDLIRAHIDYAGDSTIWTDEQIHRCLGHINDALSEDFQLD